MPLPRAGDYAPASQDVVVLILRLVRWPEADPSGAALTAASVLHPLAMTSFASLNAWKTRSDHQP
jgi:hypothetical protein